MLNKHKTRAYLYCILATVTHKVHVKNYTNILALQCKNSGDRKALKFKEEPKHDSILFFHDKKYCALANPEIAFYVPFGSS